MPQLITENKRILLNKFSPGSVSIKFGDLMQDLEDRVAASEGDISTIEGDISDIEGDITTIEGNVTALQTAAQETTFKIFDDFICLTESDSPWILNKGSDGQALDPAVNIQERGVLRLTTGDNSGTLAEDGSQIVCAIPVQADSGDLVFEARLKINTAITGVSVNVGLTDSTSLEEPFSIATATITSTATDAACFVYDADATTKEWYACSVDGDTDDTGNATTTVAPVADTWQILRITVSADGNTVRFYTGTSQSNMTLKKTLTNAGVSPDVNLYATIVANSTTTASKTVDVDYIKVQHTR